MISIIKKMVAIGLIGGGITFAVLIVKESNKKIAIDPTTNISRKTEPLVTKEELPNQRPAANNSTEEMAKKIAEELAKKGSNDSTGSVGQIKIRAGNPEELVSQVLSDQLKNIDVENLAPVIKISELKIVETDDKQVSENYFKNSQAILKKEFSNLSLDLSQPSIDDFKSLASVYDKVISSFYSLIVPKSLAEIHRQEIRLLTIQKNIFENLSNYETDPLKAFISTKIYPEIDKQFSALKKEVAKYIIKNSLNVSI